ncbi:MAG: hypothetical protein ACJAZ2_001480, partial [Glaciecola sp.]
MYFNQLKFKMMKKGLLSVVTVLFLASCGGNQ